MSDDNLEYPPLATTNPWQQLVENINEVFWLASPDHSQIFYVSPAYEQVFHRPLASVYHNPQLLFPTIDPEAQQQINTTFEQRQQGQITSSVYPIRLPNGSVRWLRTKTFPLLNQQQVVYRTAGISQDITEFKQLEVENNLVQNTIAAVLESTDFRSTLKVVLEKGCEFTGWDLAEAWLPNADGTAMFNAAYYTRDGDETPLAQFHHQSQNFSFSPGVGLPGRVWVSQRPEWDSNVSSLPDNIYLRSRIARDFGIKTALGIPLLADNLVLGVLVFYVREEREEDEKLVELICALAQLGYVVRNKQMELTLQEAEQKYRQIFENAVDGIFQTTTDPEGRYITANAMLAHIYGYTSVEEFIGAITSIKQQIYVDPERRGEFIRLLQQQDVLWNFESRVYRLDGSIIWICENAHRVCDGDGNLLYYEGSVEDITERKHNEEKVRLLNAQLEARVEERTAALQSLNESLVREIAERQNTEIALRKSEAKLRSQALELQQTLKQLQQTQSKLVHTEKMSSLGQLVAGIAHELNNPMSFISGNLYFVAEYVQKIINLIHLYQREYPQTNPSIQLEMEEMDFDYIIADLPKIISSMKLGTKRIRGIMESLRNFSRIDESDLKLVDVHSGLDGTLMILQHRLKRQGDRPTIEMSKNYGKLPLVECYAGQLNQVFMNLLANAIDAIEESLKANCQGQNYLPKISITTEVVNPNRVAIRIADNGVGMTQQVQKRLFEPFFTTKAAGKGTGLGLSISHQIVVDQHQGVFQCQSEEGVGTEFIVEIPVQLTHES